MTSPASPPVVLDSYMKPVVSRTREITDKDGNTEKVVEPLVQERHETVAIPGQETHVTTVHQEQQDTVQSTEQAQTKRVVAHKCVKRHVAYRPRHIQHVACRTHHVAYRPVHKYVAMANKTQKSIQTTNRTVVNEQTIQSPATVIERRDPALDLE